MKQKFTIFLLSVICTFATFAQKAKVTGIVTDDTHEPLIGVSVNVDGESKGVVTDIDGAYTIEAAPGSNLVFSYIGYKTTTVPVKANSNINVTLFEDTNALEEVVVMGYGATTKKNLTTSISKIKADEVSKAGTTNMSQMLMGRAAGLQATMSSAQPGGGVNITVRGGGQPIYVVDGVIMPTGSLEGSSGGSTTVMPSSVDRSGLAGINPEDIESIEVLKDASASIYGVNAANGVILITTKQGKEGQFRVTYNGSFSIVRNYDYMQTLDAKDYMTYVNNFKKEQYLYNNGMGVYGNNVYDGGNTDAFTADQIAGAQTTNWRDQILRNGNISSHNVIIQGGTKTISYYFSGNYYRQEGTVMNSNYERYTLRSNVVAQLTDFLKFTSNINYNKNNNNNGTVGGTTAGRGAQASGALTAALAYPSHLPIKDENGKYTTYLTIPNAVGMLDMQDFSQSEGISINFTADIDIIKNWLKGKFLYGYNRESTQRSIYIPSTVYYDQMFRSRGALNYNFRDNNTLEGTLIFNHKFGEFLDLDAVVGMGRYINHTNGMSDSYTDINDVIGNDNISAASGNHVAGSYRTTDEKRSQFGRISLAFLDRYIINASLRRDGTDKFFENKKYALFPSVSAAWKIYNESFMRDIEWIDMLKLRASYGETGNDNLGSTLYGYYGVMGNHVMFSETAANYIPYYLASKDYKDVTWEKTVMKNIGVDFALFNNRISGSFDVFRNDVTDMLGYANSNGLSMFGTYPINGGHIRRYGWDASINTTNIESHEFKWTSMITLSHYNAIWKEHMPNTYFAEYQKPEDEPVNALYFYRTEGIINAEKSNIPASQPENYRLPGCPIIKDLNGDGKITVDDVEQVNVIPDLYWGFGNTFTYKNWDLDVFIYSQLGLKKLNYAYDWSNPTNLANQNMNQGELIKNCFDSERNPNGTLPGVAYYLTPLALPGGAGTDFGYENADFLRVRNITLGYTFTKNMLGAVNKYISSIRLYVDAQNPFTFTSFKTFDPEVKTGGNYKGGKAEYPMTRTYTVGLKVTF